MSQYVESSIGTPGVGLRNVTNGNPSIDSLFLEVFCVIFGSLIVAFIIGQQWSAAQEKKEQKAQLHEGMGLPNLSYGKLQEK